MPIRNDEGGTGELPSLRTWPAFSKILYVCVRQRVWRCDGWSIEAGLFSGKSKDNDEDRGNDSSGETYSRFRKQRALTSSRTVA